MFRLRLGWRRRSVEHLFAVRGMVLSLSDATIAVRVERGLRRRCALVMRRAVDDWMGGRVGEICLGLGSDRIIRRIAHVSEAAERGLLMSLVSVVVEECLRGGNGNEGLMGVEGLRVECVAAELLGCSSGVTGRVAVSYVNVRGDSCSFGFTPLNRWRADCAL